MGDHRILVVDDEFIVRDSISAWLREEGFSPDCVESGRQALEMLRTQNYSLILLDLRMPGMDGIETLREIRRIAPGIPVVMMTAYADVPTAVEAMKSGAQDYVSKPFDPDEITSVIKRVIQTQEVTGSLQADLTPGSESWSYEDFIGVSRSMAGVIEMARKAAETNAAIHLVGERGLGKECLARAIHSSSQRKFGPFITIRCSGISEGVLEGDLFGYEKQGLPNASSFRKGRLELADRGTAYFDEIGGLSHRLQVQLLHVLEDKAVVRLGGEKRNPVDVRVISASSVGLEELVRSGNFLPELYQILTVLVIKIPPLRERREDIPSLANRLLLRARKELGKQVNGISPAAMEVLVRYDWPGNVRELSRVIERAAIACSGGIIEPEHIRFG